MNHGSEERLKELQAAEEERILDHQRKLEKLGEVNYGTKTAPPRARSSSPRTLSILRLSAICLENFQCDSNHRSQAPPQWNHTCCLLHAMQVEAEVACEQLLVDLDGSQLEETATLMHLVQLAGIDKLFLMWSHP
eukprot:83544-Amphidinium_carterae.1